MLGNERNHVAMGGLLIDLGGSLWPTFWSSAWSYRRRSQQYSPLTAVIAIRAAWAMTVRWISFGRGKPKSELATNHLRADLFEWSGNPFRYIVWLGSTLTPKADTVFGFVNMPHEKSFDLLIQWFQLDFGESKLIKAISQIKFCQVCELRESLRESPVLTIARAVRCHRQRTGHAACDVWCGMMRMNMQHDAPLPCHAMSLRSSRHSNGM